MGTEKTLSLPVKKALVTGGGGFVGKAVVKMLLDCGVACSVLGRNSYPELTELGVECFVGNIADAVVVAEATKDVDIVFHVAALAGIWGPWDDYYQTNVVGTENVVQSCLQNGVDKLVYTSTPSVVFNREDICGGDEQLDYAEDFLCHYAKSKVMAEKIVFGAQSKGLSTCSLRPHLIWGPGDPHLLPRLLESGRKKKLKQVGEGKNLVDISYIDNVAYAHLLAARNLCTTATASGKAYFISQGKPVNLWDWINELFKAMGVPPVIGSMPFTTASKIGGIIERVYTLVRIKKEPRMTRFLAEQLAKSHYFSTRAAQQDLGYEPLVSTEEGLRRTIAWLQLNEANNA